MPCASNGEHLILLGMELHFFSVRITYERTLTRAPVATHRELPRKRKRLWSES